jgi:hypothetical protein
MCVKNAFHRYGVGDGEEDENENEDEDGLASAIGFVTVAANLSSDGSSGSKPGKQ